MTDVGAPQAASEDVDAEIFERFNEAMGLGIGDVYADVAAEREKHVAFFGVMPLANGERNYAVQALSYEAVEEILRDGRRFSSSAYSEILGPIFGRSILEMDEPEHHLYRGLLQPAFTRGALRRWETTLILPVIDRLIDQFCDTGSADLVKQFAFPFPLMVTAGLLGLPDDLRKSFHRLAIELISVTVDPATAARASAELGELLQPLIDHRRDHPGDDVISVLTQAEFEGRRLTDAEVLSFCRLLAPAGVETTYRSTSNVLFGLLTNPDQLEAVRLDRDLVPRAIEEGLRWECPTPAMVRRASCDTKVCGVAIRAGTFVIAHVGSANRDPSRWEAPDDFDVLRPPRPNLATGTGPHTCLGGHLSRMEVVIALNRLLDRLTPGLVLDPDAPPPSISGYMFRSPPSLRVVFPPTS